MVSPGQRSDALQNRGLILSAARALFSSSFAEVSMDAVAKKAGVGRATLYRNFPDIDSLSAAIFEENIRTIEATIAREADSPGSFERVLLATIDEGLSCRALMPALASRAQSPEVGELMSRVTRPLGVALKQAQVRGEVRDDLTSRDIVPLMAMLFATVLADPGARDPRARVRRMTTLLLEGIRPR
ncbi:MAG: TetR/AcrR family transcriptional regulator [Archangium sp.]